MPTDQELKALCDKCDWIRATTNDVNGYVVRGRGDYASASIFLPCAGRGTSLEEAGSDGWYWSSVPVSDYDRHAWGLDFSSSFHDTCVNDRYYGQSVRPVQGFSK